MVNASCSRPWFVALAASMIAALAVLAAAALWWNSRPQPDRVEQTLTKLAMLDEGMQRKVCAHRNNNIPKYRAANEIFHCIEIDVVLDPQAGGPAAVYHPPHENHHGLSLDFLLSNERLPRGNLWLDVKDLSEGNWQQFIGQLVDLINPSRRGDVVVETGWSTQPVRDAAEAFVGNGFQFSYYLPTEAIECGLSDSRNCNELRAAVVETVALGFSHLSFDARAYPFVQSIRGDLPPHVRLLTWHLSGAWPRMDLLREVEIYIVRFPNPFST
jgi:hypothetical protein